MVTTRAFQIGALNEAVGAGGPLEESKVGLFTNNITPSKTTVMGDLEPATSAGLAVQASVPWGPAFEEGDGSVKVTGIIAPFIATSLTGLPLTLYGWFAADTAGTGLMVAKRFPDPIVCTEIGDGVVFVPEINYGD